jgi:hypothetical protein
MGLKNFLREKGFIEDDSKIKSDKNAQNIGSQASSSEVAPTFFPLNSNVITATSPSNDTESEPSFVTPLEKGKNETVQPDPTFVKFFEDELVKANLPGPDYFEFRQLLIKTQQKMATKGMVAPEVVLQAVLMSFEAQEISPAKLVEAARQYKEIIKQKNDDFLKGASTEKNNQLQKRQNVLQAHNDNIKKIQLQLQPLELQRQQLESSLNKEKTQMDVDKTLGQEGIEKIEKAERLISSAHSYIQSTIDNDIKRLQSV